MLIAVIIFLGLVALLWLWLLSSPVHRASLRYVLDAATSIPGVADADLPPVTIIVPARNEAKVLGAAIPSMCAQEYPNLRVVLVDDQSDDDSPIVIGRLREAHSNLVVIPGRERPAGWCGKPWAVQQGVQWAMSEDRGSRDNGTSEPWLLFTDADCIFHPRAVRQAMAHAVERKLDMVSIIPSLTFSSTIERIGVGGLVSVLLLLFPLGWANDPKRAMALTAGAFMLVRRSAYDKAGGHAAVRAQIIEDMNLGKNIKAAGSRIESNFTRDLVHTEMYESFSDMWEGLSKNAYAGMEYQPHKFWTGLAVGFVGAILPPVYLLATLTWAMRAGTVESWTALTLAGIANLGMVLIHARTVRFQRGPWYDVFLLPVSAGLYGLIALNSMWQHHFAGGNVWKGRRYDRQMLLSSTANEESA